MDEKMIWRLPTIEELDWLYQNKKELFDEGCYWSSSDDGNVNAWGKSFVNGYQYDGYKDDSYLVRPVRGSGDNLEVYPSDLGKMSWNDAKEACEKLNDVKIETASMTMPLPDQGVNLDLKPLEKIKICFSGGQILEFVGRYRKDLEVKNWHYYEDDKGKIIHCRKSQMVYVVGGLHIGKET